MIKHLPPRTLLLMDAYYVGYDLWTALIKHQTHWLMRVGANVRLIQDLIPGRVTIDRRAGIVYVWRRPAARSSPDEEPLRLRLIRVGGKKNGIHLLTTVLDPTRLSRKRAGELYRMRWGVEVFYRSIKQIMGATKLGSRTPMRARLELNWTIVAAAALALLSAGVVAAATDGSTPRAGASPARCGLCDAGSTKNFLAAAPDAADSQLDWPGR